jgi:PAS domain S-box-containing protein
MFIHSFIHSYSQDIISDYRFEYLTTEQGLSSNRIICVYRDSKGFLWTGSDIGLDRYDGYSFIAYRNDEQKPKSLSGKSVHCILEDSRNNLWIGTSDGLNIYDRSLDSFIVFKNNPKDKNSLKSNNIICIFEDSRKNLWVVTSLGCIHKWNPQKQNFQRYEIPNNSLENLIRDTRSIAEDSKGNLWVVSFSPDFFRFNPQNGEFINYANSKINLGKCTKGLCIDCDDNIWIYTYGSGLFMYANSKKEFRKFKIANDGTGINGSAINSVIEDDKNHVLVGVDQGGINRYDKRNKHFEYISYDENSAYSLNNNGIWSLYKDKEGVLYATGSGGGISCYNPGKSKFKTFKHQKNNPKSLSYDLVSSFYQDKYGKIWIGTDEGLNLFDPKTETFTIFQNNKKNKYSLPGNSIICISGDKENNLWIATWDAGLIKFDGKNFYSMLSDINKPDYIYERIMYLMVDHNDLLWISLYNGGIIVYDKKKGITKQFRNQSGNPYSLNSDNVKYIYEDDNFNIWLCTTEGLCIFDTIKQCFSRIKGLPDGEIRAIYIDAEKNHWVGTADNGLIKLNKDRKVVRYYKERNGLSSNTIHAITEDNIGNIWISTNNGICRINKKTDLIRYYSGSDGIEGNEFYRQSFLKTKKGEIYFGGFAGFNSFLPDSMIDNTTIPEVIITDFQILNKNTLALSENGILKHISTCDGIIIQPWQNVFSFFFTATNFNYPQNNHYAYMLEGFDKDWIYTDYTRRFVSYTNLNHGEYTFRVKASNNDDIWNEKGVSLRIRVLPFWWETWWFRIIAIFAGLLAITGFFYFRLHNLTRQKKILEKEVKERTTQVVQQNEELYAINVELDQQKEELKATLETFFEQVADGIIIFDNKGNILMSNASFSKIIGYQPEEIKNMNIRDFFDATELKNNSFRFDLIEKGEIVIRERKAKKKDKTIIDIELQSQKLTNGKIESFIRDITQKKQMQKEIYIAGINAEEQERSRLAKDLHDGLGPLLSTCRIYLHKIKNKGINDIDSFEKLEEIIDESLIGIKEISNNISPHILRNFGLIHALKSFIEKVSDKCQIDIISNCDPAKRFEEIIEVTIYRVLTELLNNTIKYAKAHTANVQVNKENDRLFIEYSDDGIGFDYTETLNKNKGFGLLNIKSRIESIGGQYEFLSEPGKGVFIRILIDIQ